MPVNAPWNLVSEVRRLINLLDFSKVYENPLLVATSRSVLEQIHALVNRLLRVDLPNPLNVIARRQGAFRPLLQLWRVWSEVLEISESESFGVYAV